jgi:ribonuclease J
MARIGVRVVHSGLHDVHATGHAKAEEIKTLISVIRPEYMIPVHGEYRHMQAHAELAKTMGVKESNVLICEDGDRVKLTVVHDGFEPDSLVREMVSEGWPRKLADLKTGLEKS